MLPSVHDEGSKRERAVDTDGRHLDVERGVDGQHLWRRSTQPGRLSSTRIFTSSVACARYVHLRPNVTVTLPSCRLPPLGLAAFVRADPACRLFRALSLVSVNSLPTTPIPIHSPLVSTKVIDSITFLTPPFLSPPSPPSSARRHRPDSCSAAPRSDRNQRARPPSYQLRAPAKSDPNITHPLAAKVTRVKDVAHFTSNTSPNVAGASQRHRGYLQTRRPFPFPYCAARVRRLSPRQPQPLGSRPAA